MKTLCFGKDLVSKSLLPDGGYVSEITLPVRDIADDQLGFTNADESVELALIIK